MASGGSAQASRAPAATGLASGRGGTAAGGGGTLLITEGLASSRATLETFRTKRSSPLKAEASQAVVISTARVASTSRAPRQRTLASSSSRDRRAACASWQRAGRMPRSLLAAIEALVPLPP